MTMRNDASMKSKRNKKARQAIALLAVAFVAMVIFSPLVTVHAASTTATEQSEYQQFVHTYYNSTKGNLTIVDKPMFPIYFNEDQIPIGGNWSIIEPLVAGHSYHVYCYGAWVNDNSQNKTDYNIYVYNPSGALESEHTSAAGLPEHLGTDVNDTFFTPSTTGNYTFVIQNHLGTSQSADPATFMAIEDVETNTWLTANIGGLQPNGTPAYNTAWAYEFVSDSPHIEVDINVPSTLDVYEARLYVMSSPQSLILNNVPLPWEPGLYGNQTDEVGGYNLNADGYSGVAYASCEYSGQSMQISYNSTQTGKTLYQLVFIGETGEGNVAFLIKTQFGEASLLPSNDTGLLTNVSPENDTTISYTSNSTTLTNAVLQYTTDQWSTTMELPMKIDNQTCRATIPRQQAGTQVFYRIEANDSLMNSLSAEGDFTVKQPSNLDILTTKTQVNLGQNITINGEFTGANKSVPIQLQFMSATTTQEVDVETQTNGTFTANFQPNSPGVWAVQSSFQGDSATFPCDGNMLTINVIEPPLYIKYSTILGGGGFFGVVALMLAYYVKKRRQ